MREHLGHILHLIQNGGCLHRVEKTLRISSEPRDHVRIFKQEIAGIGIQVPQQPGFACSTRACQDHGGKRADALETCCSSSRGTYRMVEDSKV